MTASLRVLGPSVHSLVSLLQHSILSLLKSPRISPGTQVWDVQPWCPVALACKKYLKLWSVRSFCKSHTQWQLYLLTGPPVVQPGPRGILLKAEPGQKNFLLEGEKLHVPESCPAEKPFKTPSLFYHAKDFKKHNSNSSHSKVFTKRRKATLKEVSGKALTATKTMRRWCQKADAVSLSKHPVPWEALSWRYTEGFLLLT